jgi:hypothetical protein
MPLSPRQQIAFLNYVNADLYILWVRNIIKLEIEYFEFLIMWVYHVILRPCCFGDFIIRVGVV